MPDDQPQEESFSLHAEEFRYLRKEIESNIAAVRQNERYAAIAMALVYGWLFTQTGSFQLDSYISIVALMWWFPIIIPAILFIRYETLRTEIEMAADYIRQLEKQWRHHATGWEHFVETFAHQHWNRYERQFWVILVTGSSCASSVLHFISLDAQHVTKGPLSQCSFLLTAVVISVIVSLLIIKQSQHNTRHYRAARKSQGTQQHDGMRHDAT